MCFFILLKYFNVKPTTPKKEKKNQHTKEQSQPQWECLCNERESIDIKVPRLDEIASKVDDNDHNQIHFQHTQKERSDKHTHTNQQQGKKTVTRNGRNDKTKNIY